MSELPIFAHFLFFGERCEWFAQIKWVTMSDSLRSLRGNEQLWANRLFLDKKRVICMDIKWANSQPCALRESDVLCEGKLTIIIIIFII